MFRLIKKLLSKEEVIVPQVKTINISSKYLKNRLPDISEFNFKNRRVKLGLTLEEVDSLSSVSKSVVSRIERSVLDYYFYGSVMKLHNFYLQKESEVK